MRTPYLSPFLAANAAVAALAGDRFYPDKIPQQAIDDPNTGTPCIVYARTDVEEQMLFCGADDLVRVVMQVDAYALSYDDAEALAAAVRDALMPRAPATGMRTGYAGPMGPVVVQTVTPDTESVPGPEPDPGLFRVFQSFNIWCREAS